MQTVPSAAVGLLDDVRADPADVGGHLLVADLLRPRGGRLQLLRGLPAVAPANDVQVHGLLHSGVPPVS